MDSTERDRGRKRNRERSYVSRPLIPTNVLDQASQRMFIISLFIIIQSWKIYDLVLLKTEIPFSDTPLTSLNNFTFVLKYSFLDGLFIFFLPILNIQYLTFSPFHTIIIFVTLFGSSIFLVSSMALPLLSNVFLPVWKFLLQKKELNIVGESIDRNKVIDMDSHFKGQLTIQYLPDSSARMNPFHYDQTCLGLENNHLLNMPIEFNTTSGIGYLQIQRTTPDNQIEYLNYTGHSLRSLFKKDYSHLAKEREYKKSDPRVFYLEYPIQNPGMYRIKNVLDNKGNSIKTYKSEFAISDCPSAKFFYPPNFETSNGFKCMSSLEDDTFPLPWIELFSTTPASIKLNLKVDGNEFKMMNLSIGQESSGHGSRTNFNWLKASKLVRNILYENILNSKYSFLKNADSVLEFQLLQVQDSLGNIHRYQPLSKDKDVWYKLKLKKSSTIGLYDTQKDRELLIGGTKTLSVSHLDSFGEDDFPVAISVEHVTKEGAQNITATFKNKGEMKNGITIDKPGTYRLITAKDKYCPCEISGEPIDIQYASLPDLDIIAEPVSDRCLGTVGYNFGFNFTGKTPFKVQYKIYSNSSGVLEPVPSETGRFNRELTSYEKSHSFKFKPPSEGSYAIVFSNLRDANYNKDPIKLDETKHIYSTYFRQASQIGFQVSQRTLRTCYGQAAHIPVSFKGSGPFTFEYEFLDINSKKKLLDTVHVDKVDSYTIDPPNQLLGKAYEVRIVSAKDKFGCDAIITDKSRPLNIISRSEIPEVEFDQSEKNVSIVEGSSVNIPLKFKSSVAVSGNDKIEMKYLSPQSNNDPVVIQAQLSGSSVKLSKEGTYWLSSYTSNGCQGHVVNEQKSVIVNYFPKPSMRIVAAEKMLQHSDDSTIHLKPVCYGCDNEVKLQMTGKAPFVVDYEIKLPNGKLETHSMNIAGNEISIKLPTKASGRFEHQFKRVYDSLYTKNKGKIINANVPKLIYDVNPLPTAQFLPDNHFAQICDNKLSESSIVANIPIQLSGSYPFDIYAVLTNEKTGKTHELTFRNVMSDSIVLENLSFLKLGDYSLSFTKIIDNNGCVGNKFQANDKFIVSITEPPNIFKTDPNKKHYCVGDHVSYNLTGVYPVTIYYEYNNKLRNAESYNYFERLASRPGVLNIHGLQDSGINSCTVNYTFDAVKQEELRLQVHEIPTVEVNKGDYIIEDLHEGDQTELIFTFLGEPPFKLTYIRTVDIKKNKKTVRKLVEKETISDIWEHQLVVMASLEGTYEAIEIEDKYCRAIKKVDYIE
ncbi:hypothetical protein SBY92_001910 [Candida maltosa Xu316]